MQPVKYKSFASKRPFGIELEVGPEVTAASIRNQIENYCVKEIMTSRWAQSINNNYWHVKQDSTCGPRARCSPDGTAIERDYGFEIASYKASGIEDILHIADVASRMKDIGVRVNPNCGFHIHGEILHFSPGMVGVMLARWIKIEPVICALVDKSRLQNPHCQLWHKKPGITLEDSWNGRRLTGEQFYNQWRPNNFGTNNNTQKRVSLNLVNFAASIHQESTGRKTVELRLPEGTLDKTDIASWIKLFLLFIDNCETASMPLNLKPIETVEELFKYVGLAGDDGFYLLSKGMYSLKKWILKKILDSQWIPKDRNYREYRVESEKIFERISCVKK